MQGLSPKRLYLALLDRGRRIITWLPAVLAARRSEAALEQAARSVLILCHGNIYRSPLAAALLAARRPDLQVCSAGFHDRPDRRTPEAFAELAHGLGVDLTCHRSRVASREMMDAAQLVVIMDRRNAAALRSLGGHDRVLWLGILLGKAEIADPYGRAASVQESIAKELDSAIRRLAETLPTA